jgi:hypothetical protein
MWGLQGIGFEVRALLQIYCGGQLGLWVRVFLLALRFRTDRLFKDANKLRAKGCFL